MSLNLEFLLASSSLTKLSKRGTLSSKASIIYKPRLYVVAPGTYFLDSFSRKQTKRQVITIFTANYIIVHVEGAITSDAIGSSFIDEKTVQSSK